MCGTGTPPGWNSNWKENTTGLPDDIAYARASVDLIKRTVKVLPNHVYAMGHSNGAFMSETLACNASDVFSAIASNAGATVLGPTISTSLDYCSAAYGSNATAILLIHGIQDQAVAYNGTATMPSVLVDMNAWAKRNQCQGQVQPLWSRGIATSQGWSQCAHGAEVELVTINSERFGNHQWYINSDFRSSEYTFQFFNRVLGKREQMRRKERQ